jgi:hypothetical protein
MPTDATYSQDSDSRPHSVSEQSIEDQFIGKLRDLKYTDRPDIHDRASLEKNFREKFEALNRVRLTDAEFARLLEEIVTPDVFTAAKTLRQINAFTRDDDTPLNYTLVNIKDWCKNTFEVVNQLRINTDYSHHRYDILLLINGVPCVQIELKTLGIHPRRAMEQIVDYKNDPGNGYTKTLLCFLQLFIVSNRDSTYYFANNNARHFSFNQDERFLPIYQFADEANKKITHLDDFAANFLVKCTLGHTISRYMVLTTLGQLEQQMPFLIGLSREDRVRLAKVGNRTRPFVDDAIATAVANPGIVPRSVDVATLDSRVTTFDNLKEVERALAQLLEKVTDTRTQLGSDLFAVTRSVYAVMKTTATVPGLNDQKDKLAKRFVRKARRPDTTTTVAKAA